MAESEALDVQIQYLALLTQKSELIMSREINSAESVKKSRDEHVKNKKSLKSDLKKTTAFVKKVKNINAEGLQQCIRDTETLNLTLYISEIVVALLETAFKVTDVALIVKLCACLHKRYDEFTDPLIAGLRSSLLAPLSDDDAEGSKRRRIQTRFLIELFQAGLFTDEAFFISVIKMLLGKRKALTNAGNDSGAGGVAINKKFADLQGLTVFVKYGSEILLGYCPPKMQAVCIAAGKPLETSTLSFVEIMSDECPIKLLTSSLTCKTIREQLQPAFDQLSEDLVASHKDLQKKKIRFEKDYLLHGSLSEEKQQQLDLASKFFEKLLSVVQSLCESMGVPMVELQDEEKEEEEEKKGGLTVVERIEAEYGPYGDAESKQFYDDLPDLLATMPLSLFGLSEEQAQATREKWKSDREKRLGTSGENDKEGDEKEEYDDKPCTEPLSDAGAVEGPAEEADGEHTTSFAKLAILLSERLPDCVNAKKADQFCESFCQLQPTKGHRKKLVSALLQVQRTRMELTGPYSRIIASLGRIFSDIAPPVLETLRGKFFGALKNKGQIYIDHKTLTIKYVSELAKFGVAPPMYVFRIFRDLLGEFYHHNVDLTARLMEECGRYLYLLPHCRSRMVTIMDTALRLKGVRNLDMRQSALLESAYFAVKPLEKEVRIKVEYSMVQRYARHLIVEKLNSSNCTIDTVVRALRRLPWEDKEENIEEHVLVAMLHLTSTKYVSIIGLADCLSGLNRYLNNVITRFVDTLLELIHRGLEIPYRREPQKLIGAVKMIAELYNYEVLSSSLVYDTLYKIINIGHEGVYEGTTGSVTEGHYKHSEEKVEREEADEILFKPSSPRYIFDKKSQRIVCQQKYDPRIFTDLDPPHDTFRAQLVCEILKACGAFFVSLGTRMRLTRFLTYFQRWLLTKPVLPVHVEYLILDTFDALEEGAYEADLMSLEKKKGIASGVDSKGKKLSKAKALEEAKKLLRQKGPVFPRYETMSSVVDAIAIMEAKEAAVAAARALSGDAIEDEEDTDEDGDESYGDGQERDGEEEDEEEDNDDEEEDNDDDDDGDVDDDDDDDAEWEDEDDGEERVNSEEINPIKTRTREQIEDDEEFESAFRDMMTESVNTAQMAKNTSRGANVNRMAIPAVLPRPKNLPKGMDLDQFETLRTVSAVPPPAPAPMTTKQPTALRDWAESDSDSGEDEDAFDISSPAVPIAASTQLPVTTNIPGNPFGKGVVFKMLSRDSKGKVEARVLAVPEESTMVQKLAQAQGEAQAEKERLKQQTLALQKASDGSAPRGGGRGSIDGNVVGSGAPGMGLDEYLDSVRQDELRTVQNIAAGRGGGAKNDDPPLKARDLGKW